MLFRSLNMTLDMRQGEVSERLRAIYQFCNLHLTQATIRSDPRMIDDVIRLLSELREAWQQIAASPPAIAAAA